MNDLRKAAEMAYEVMTDIHQVCDGANHKRKDMHPYGGDCPIQKRFDDAWEALRQALAQPEQEPVAWIHTRCGHPLYLSFQYHAEDVPLYTAPPKREWVGLTENEIEEIARWADKNAAPWYLEYAKGIEAKLKEKNV